MANASTASRPPTRKVLVLGSDTRSFLSVIRSLGRRRLRVHVGWCPPDSPALSSRYIAQNHDIPPYSPTDDSWKQVFLALLARERFDLIIPCNDETLLPLHEHRSDFEAVAQLAIPKGRAFAGSFDKFETYELARSLGIRVAKGMRISRRDQADEVLAQFTLPVVLKPRASANLADLTTKNYVLKAYSPDQLKAHLDSLLWRGDEVLVQENFIGTGIGIEVLALEGQVLVAFQHVRVHEPLMGGGSSYRKSQPLDPRLLEASRQFLCAINYTGVAMLEFKVNPQTADWILVEINGRFWGSLPLALAAGVDFPYYLYAMLLEGRREFPQPYKEGLYCRNLVKDLGWTVQNLRADRSDPTLATRPLWRVVADAANFLTLRERSDTFVLDDPRPGFAELAQVLTKVTAAVREKVVLAALALPPLRSRSRRKARQAIAQAKTLLFVCKGNICRSPFAQRYARTVLPRSVEVLSSGHYPIQGRPPLPQAIKVARDFGVDLSDHRSTVLSEDIIRRADVILTFDEENRRTVLARYPLAKGKVFRLGVLAAQGPVSIRDPHANEEDIRAVYESIKRCIDACVK